MDGQKAENANVGMRLLVAGKATLTIGEKDLAISGSISKKTTRNSCGPFTAGADGQLSIPFYNILWAEYANGTVTIDYTIERSSSKLERKTQFFQTAPNDAAPPGQPDPETFVAAVMSRAYGRAMRQKRIYVLINPNSGPGNSVRMFENEARSIFEAARMKVDSVVLKKGGVATDIVEKVDIDKYDTIAAVSGDGTPYEIFNGLAKRPDARRALAKIAVSHIPGGSGNAKSNTWNGTNYAGPAALAIVKGIVTPLDLASITQGNTRTISLLSQAVGIMAEADLLTEDMRWLGNKRFDVGLLKRVFLKKCYPFDLAMKVELEGKDNIKAFYKRHRDTNGASAEWDRVTVDGYAEDDKSEGLPTLRYGTINDELPQGWELVRYENIGNFFAGNLSLVTEKSSFWPAALPSDGCQDMITIEGTIPIHKAAQALMDTESDKFFANPNVTYRKVSAYRIIPHDKTGVISVDGESIPWGPFQLETHRGLGRVLMRDGRFQHPGPKGWENAQI